MTRAAICGGADLVAAAGVLGLVEGADPELVLVDLRSDEAVTRAATIAASTPRVLVATGAIAHLLRAAGAPHVAPSAAPEVLGPQVAQALPRRARDTTRTVIVTAARGGTGRTLLATNLARRLARSVTCWLVDATGTGAAAWWLRVDARPWSDLEPMTPELTTEHLRIVAVAPVPGVRVIGGAGSAPSAPLLAACLRELQHELVVVDAALLADECTRALAAADPTRRTIVLTYPDAASLAALAPHDLGAAWLIAAQGRLADRTAFRSLPRDDDAVAAALSARGPVGGRLGRAYDELAELIAIDAT